MKKFLSIKNSQGIYVARASFSSDETVIDFVNNKQSDNCNIKPVSIGFSPENFGQLRVATPTPKPKRNHSIAAIESTYESISVPSESLSVAAKTKKKRLTKVLQLLHLKKKSKMSDHLNDEKKAIEMPSTSSSLPVLPSTPTPKLARSKGRTAALVKKFSLTPKKSPPKELSSIKKSSIPLRASSEAISNAPSQLHNRVEATASVSHHSRSEMNLVNIDYRQESSGDNLDVGVKVGQTQYRTIRSGNQSAGSGESDNNNFTRAWNASSNLSIKSGPWPPPPSSSTVNVSGKTVPNTIGRKSSSTEKLQITISGKKRMSTADSVSELTQQRKQPLHETEPRRIERKALTMQQSPKKFNINHDLTLMNTVGVPPAPTTQAPSAIPLSIRATTAPTMPTTAAPTIAATTATSIKNVVQSSTAIKAQSTMQSQQSVDASASAADVGYTKQFAPLQSAKSKTELITVTSFDIEEPDDLVAASKIPGQEEDTSLLTEIIEAERRNSMDLSERGRRYPGAATGDTVIYQAAGTSDSVATASTSASERKPSQPEIIPKVIIEEYPSVASEKTVEKVEVKIDKLTNSDIGDTNIDTIIDTDNELLNTLTQSSGAKQFQQPNEAADNDTTATIASHPTLQFEVGKQVRPIFPSNQNLHHNTYSALDNDPATAYTSILTSYTSSYIDTHNIDTTFAHVHAEPKSAPVLNVHDKELIIGNIDNNGRGTNQTRSHLQVSRGRRRIAYMDSSSKSNDSLSTSNSTINTEDDIYAENHLDSATLSQFSNLHTSSTLITDFVMPPYGDLVWDDDGVIERIRTCHFFY